jgi:3-oxoacyl-[acyl-carrier protein] reductase
MMRLQGRAALVTGSSSGIGRAIATRFAHEGADLVINGRDEKKIAEVVKEIEALGRRALGIRANVGSFAESKAMVERAIAELGHLDILVCSSGVFHHTPFLELSEEEWDEVLTVDLKGAFNCARAAIGQMVARKWGRIICVTAVTGLTGYAGLAHIGAAKTGVTANAIAPGLVDTPILVNFTEEGLANFRRGIPVGRIGKPEEIAEAALYFASDESGYVTGQVLNMSGGSYI